jgi:hypothetical protein
MGWERRFPQQYLRKKSTGEQGYVAKKSQSNKYFADYTLDIAGCYLPIVTTAFGAGIHVRGYQSQQPARPLPS